MYCNTYVQVLYFRCVNRSLKVSANKANKPLLLNLHKTYILNQNRYKKGICIWLFQFRDRRDCKMVRDPESRVGTSSPWATESDVQEAVNILKTVKTLVQNKERVTRKFSSFSIVLRTHNNNNHNCCGRSRTSLERGPWRLLWVPVLPTGRCPQLCTPPATLSHGPDN